MNCIIFTNFNCHEFKVAGSNLTRYHMKLNMSLCIDIRWIDVCVKDSEKYLMLHFSCRLFNIYNHLVPMQLFLSYLCIFPCSLSGPFLPVCRKGRAYPHGLSSKMARPIWCFPTAPMWPMNTSSAGCPSGWKHCPT